MAELQLHRGEDRSYDVSKSIRKSLDANPEVEVIGEVTRPISPNRSTLEEITEELASSGPGFGNIDLVQMSAYRAISELDFR